MTYDVIIQQKCYLILCVSILEHLLRGTAGPQIWWDTVGPQRFEISNKGTEGRRRDWGWIETLAQDPLLVEIVVGRSTLEKNIPWENCCRDLNTELVSYSNGPKEVGFSF